ncbi:LLM class flavin-dependent oxidoreductase [Rhodococcus opacus]|uniref:Nitrilotriacetate monooxygenase n=1 Tax=Rhodococcus opacus TaxID=37919 RepID=A0A2S8J8K2_RHOOP|nr:LLM class flavin-dependent oxidoreductase [Rhodococcus opacus]PQP23376.1 nitrilotriacetate monooxygenase [Rhodococcus opacus]
MTGKRPFILALNATTYGHHEASWRAEGGDPASYVSAEFYVETAKLAEQGRFDLFFLADFLAYDESTKYTLFWPMEPLSVLSAVAAATEKIGLVATGSTTYNNCYDLARLFSTLDHISGGRAGWNIVTSGNPAAATNYNRFAQVPHTERYRHGHEFVEAATKLWDSRPGQGAASVGHHSERVNFDGPLDVAPSPQGYPLFVQAGSSADGKDFAGRYAEIVFTAQTTIEQSRAFRDDVRRRAFEYGRDPDTARVIPGFAPVIGSTEEEAHRLKRDLDDLILPEKIIGYVAQWGFDLSGYDIDEPFPVEITKDPAWDGITSRFDIVKGVADRAESMTIREFVRKISGSRGHANFIGTPEQIADYIEEWWVADVNDGFMLMPTHYPSGFRDFVEQVIPLLKGRGIVQRDYGEGTLRERLVLPKQQFAQRHPAEAVVR